MRRPDLTVTGLFNSSPDRVAATLAPLRKLGAEIVLAADERVDRSWIEAYRRLADRVLVAPYPGSFAQAYGWLRAQCQGRWVLQLDADEVPSAGLAAEVADVLAADDVTHAWVPRRWLYTDPGHFLAQWPWQPDYSLRLLRNDSALVRHPSVMHLPVDVLGPKRYLRAPIYHADLLLNDLATRQDKCVRYEQGRPGLLAGGASLNEAYYLPELQPGLALAAVPAADRPAIEAFLAGPARRRAPRRRSPLTVATLEDLRAFDESRTLGESAYQGQLLPLTDDLGAAAGALRTVDIEVTNLGDEVWPAGLTARPAIRLAYRWEDEGGSRRDGLRTGLPASLRPGSSLVVPMELQAPLTPGQHSLVVDLVHEQVRWFDCGIRLFLDVRPS